MDEQHEAAHAASDIGADDPRMVEGAAIALLVVASLLILAALALAHLIVRVWP